MQESGRLDDLPPVTPQAVQPQTSVAVVRTEPTASVCADEVTPMEETVIEATAAEEAEAEVAPMEEDPPADDEPAVTNQASALMDAPEASEASAVTSAPDAEPAKPVQAAADAEPDAIDAADTMAATPMEHQG